MSGTTSDGAFVYTPNPGFSGLEEISYAIGDGNGGIAFGDLLILVVDDQNRPPVAVPDVFTTPEGTPLVVTAPGHLANDFDLDGDPVTWLSYSLPSGGTMSGTTSDGAFVYTPNPGFSGLEQISYAIGDGRGGIAFGELLIHVTPGPPAGTAPVAISDVYTTPEGTPLAVTAAIGLLANDFDPDGDPIAWLSYSLPSGGTMSGTTSDGAFVYTPNPGFSGLEEISYAIGDGNGGIAFGDLLILVVDDQNRPPVAVPDVFTTPEGTPLVVTAPGHLANDFDLDGDPVTWLSYSLPSGGTMSGTTSDGAFVYTPNPGFSGLEEISYAIGDGQGGIDFGKMLIAVLPSGVTLLPPCTSEAAILFSDWDIDPSVGPPDPRGEFAEIGNDSGDGTAYTLSGCDFLVFNPFSELVTYAADATGILTDGGTYSFATSLPINSLGQTMPPGTLPDGPSVFALIDGSATVGQSVVTVLTNTDVVAAVILGADGTVYGTVGGGAATAEANQQALLEALARLFGTAGEQEAEGLALTLQASPNPLSNVGMVSFGLEQPGNVVISLYDALGRHVALLAEGRYGPGRHTVGVDASSLPPGVYVVRMSAGDTARTAALTVVR